MLPGHEALGRRGGRTGPPLLAVDDCDAVPQALTTARLEVRIPDPDSAAAIRESFETLRRWMDWADHLPTVEETRHILVRAREAYLGDEDHSLHLFTRKPKRFIGSSGLHRRSSDATRREIGYWIRDTATGRGYATEAVQAIAAAAFRSFGLAAVEIRASARNRASHRVAERAGFVLDQVVSDGRIDPDGQKSDTHVYVLVRNAV